MKNVSNWLYADKNLENAIDSDSIKKVSQAKVVYFFDGCNGDRHLVVGYTRKSNGEINTVLALNLSQSYLDGSYNGYSNANKAAESLMVPKNGSELVAMFNNVKVFNW